MQVQTRQAFTRSIWRGLVVIVAGMWAAIRGQSATRIQVEQIRGQGPGLVGLTDAGIGQAVQVGAGLTLAAGVLTATATPAPQRQYNVILTQQAGVYPIPPECARLNIIVFRNGLRQTPTADYKIDLGNLIPVEPWAADDAVICDGE